jgi:hypothetical protein
MTLIWVINGSTYLSAMGGAVTVPGGITGGSVVLQVNDGSLSDNFGSYTFKACLTNNHAAAWTYDANFLVSGQGWRVLPSSGVPSSSYTGGSGWGYGPSADGAVYIGFDALHASTITRFDATAVVTAAHDANQGAVISLNGTTSLHRDNSLAQTPGGTLTYTGSHSVALNDVIEIQWGNPVGTSVFIVSAHLEGTGLNPFLP